MTESKLIQYMALLNPNLFKGPRAGLDQKCISGRGTAWMDLNKKYLDTV